MGLLGEFGAAYQANGPAKAMLLVPFRVTDDKVVRCPRGRDTEVRILSQGKAERQQ